MHEEDVDDLDDIADQFGNPKPPLPTSVNVNHLPHAVGPSSSSTPIPLVDTSNAGSIPSVPPEQLPDDLAKQLAEGMELLMRDLADGSNGPISEDERRRREEWERMLIEGMNGIPSEEVLGRSSPDNPDVQKDKPARDFQSSILQAMEKLKDSDSTLQTDASSAANASDDALETLLSQLGSSLDETGEDNGELQDMIETMMQQLMSKEVLYEPLKELNDKFPPYLAENEKNLSSEDKERFENQRIRVSAIVKVFEDPSYNDDDQEKGARIVSLMNEMQSFGSPPSEIMGALPAGLDFGSDGTPKLPDGCTIM